MFFLSCFICVVASQSVNIYISPFGNDDNSGRSTSLPLRTADAALKLAQSLPANVSVALNFAGGEYQTVDIQIERSVVIQTNGKSCFISFFFPTCKNSLQTLHKQTKTPRLWVLLCFIINHVLLFRKMVLVRHLSACLSQIVMSAFNWCRRRRALSQSSLVIVFSSIVQQL